MRYNHKNYGVEGDCQELLTIMNFAEYLLKIRPFGYKKMGYYRRAIKKKCKPPIDTRKNYYSFFSEERYAYTSLNHF